MVDKINIKNISKIIKFSKKLYEKYNISYSFICGKNNFKETWCGEASCYNRKIRIYYTKNILPQHLASVITHELSHILVSDAGIFLNYHIVNDNIFRDYDHLNEYIKTALDAERYVDSIAQKIFPHLFLGMPYTKFYESQNDINFLNKRLESIKKYHNLMQYTEIE